MRVASLAMDADGVVRGVLQIEPKDGWITYWREPGDAGIGEYDVELAELGEARVQRGTQFGNPLFDQLAVIGIERGLSDPFSQLR